MLEMPLPSSDHVPSGTTAGSLQQGYHVAGEPYAGRRGLEMQVQGPAAPRTAITGSQVRTGCSSLRLRKPSRQLPSPYGCSASQPLREGCIAFVAGMWRLQCRWWYCADDLQPAAPSNQLQIEAWAALHMAPYLSANAECVVYTVLKPNMAVACVRCICSGMDLIIMTRAVTSAGAAIVCRLITLRAI